MKGSKLADFLNNKCSFSVQNKVHDFRESPQSCPLFGSVYMCQKLQQGAHISVHENF